MEVSDRKYFITAANFFRLIDQSMVEISMAMEDAYHRAYELISLKPYVNEKEVVALNKQILFLEKTGEYLIDLENKAKQEKKDLNQRTSGTYVFDSGTPKYHKSEACESLTKDFYNFLIPHEIKEQGNDAVKKFKEFASRNKTVA